jgi:hypothetical protein
MQGSAIWSVACKREKTTDGASLGCSTY